MNEIISYQGWSKALRLANQAAELVITLDVGPRVLRYARPGGLNLFKEYADQMGGIGEDQWMIRGGHRFWTAPEGDHSYALDNHFVEHEIITPDTVRLLPPPCHPFGFRKELILELRQDGSVCVTHLLHNLGPAPLHVSIWALTVMAPGGKAIVPLPPKGSHPADLLPNQKVVVWPYTDLADPRFQWGSQALIVKQDASRGPTKLGLLHTQGRAAYHLADQLFIKSIPWSAQADYPDMGVNFEVFTNEDMLELESLAPSSPLGPGEVGRHVEEWRLLSADPSTDWAHTALPGL